MSKIDPQAETQQKQDIKSMLVNVGQLSTTLDQW